jgi:hypothetical protein
LLQLKRHGLLLGKHADSHSWQNSQIGIHPVVNFLGLQIGILYLIVLAWPKETLTQYIYNIHNFSRPSFWALPILEWSYCLLICCWIISFSANLAYIQRKKKQRIR